MNVALRRAVSGDVEVLDRSWTDLEQREVLSRLNVCLDAPGYFTYLLEEKEPFGLVTVGPCESLDARSSAQDTGQIALWWVLPQQRGCGYGRKLLVHGLSVLRRRLANHAQIWIPQQSDRAAEIVTKAGFEATDFEKILNTQKGTKKHLLFTKNIEGFF